MAELIANTLVRRPSGEIVLLVSGGQVPEWAADQVGEHLLAPGAPKRQAAPVKPADPASANPASSDPAKPATDGPPPKGGAGSGAPEWRAYAARKGVEVAEDANREQVIAALAEANVPSE